MRCLLCPGPQPRAAFPASSHKILAPSCLYLQLPWCLMPATKVFILLSNSNHDSVFSLSIIIMSSDHSCLPEIKWTTHTHPHPPPIHHPVLHPNITSSSTQTPPRPLSTHLSILYPYTSPSSTHTPPHPPPTLPTPRLMSRKDPPEV